MLFQLLTIIYIIVCVQVQVTAVDELYVEQDAEGSVTKQIARVRLFFLGFLSGQYSHSVADLQSQPL